MWYKLEGIITCTFVTRLCSKAGLCEVHGSSPRWTPCALNPMVNNQHIAPALEKECVYLVLLLVVLLVVPSQSLDMWESMLGRLHLVSSCNRLHQQYRLCNQPVLFAVDCECVCAHTTQCVMLLFHTLQRQWFKYAHTACSLVCIGQCKGHTRDTGSLSQTC